MKIKPMTLVTMLLWAMMAPAALAQTNPPEFSTQLSGALFPAVENLPSIPTLPDVMVMNNGKRVTTEEEWALRRKEIKDLLLHYEYGHMPPAPKNLAAEELYSKTIYKGAATEKLIQLSMGTNHSLRIQLFLRIPKGKAPFPVILSGDQEWIGWEDIVEPYKMAVDRGYIFAEFNREDLAPDEDIRGPAQEQYPDYDWSVLAVWAWEYMRCVDYLVTQDFVDPKCIAVTGWSRGGKTALLAAALDERITVCNPNGSGCGGAACLRYRGCTSEAIRDITAAYPFWFNPNFRTFANQETRLPSDQHFLKALVAPRGLISTDGLDDYWANPWGVQWTQEAAQPVFDLLGAGQNNAIHYRPGTHAHAPEDWATLFDFCDHTIYGKMVKRDFYMHPFAIPPAIKGALQSMGTDASGSVRELITFICDRKNDLYVRRSLLATLTTLCSDPNVKEGVGNVLPEAVGLLDEPSAMRRTAAELMVRFGPQAKSAVPGLIQLLQVNDPDTRLAAVQALGAIGREAKDAVPALKKLLTVEVGNRRNATEETLKKISNERVDGD